MALTKHTHGYRLFVTIQPRLYTKRPISRSEFYVQVPSPPGKYWKVLDFFPKNSRTWKVLENHIGPGKSWKLKLKVLEKYP